jgi:hypothetical protein
MCVRADAVREWGVKTTNQVEELRSLHSVLEYAVGMSLILDPHKELRVLKMHGD